MNRNANLKNGLFIILIFYFDASLGLNSEKKWDWSLRGWLIKKAGK